MLIYKQFKWNNLPETEEDLGHFYLLKLLYFPWNNEGCGACTAYNSILSHFYFSSASLSLPSSLFKLLRTTEQASSDHHWEQI